MKTKIQIAFWYVLGAILATGSNFAVQKACALALTYVGLWSGELGSGSLSIGGRDAFVFWGAWLFILGSGTGVGLVVKYVYDAHWIFGSGAQVLGLNTKTRSELAVSKTQSTKNPRTTGENLSKSKLIKYTVASLGTTVIFWGAQTLGLIWFGQGALMYTCALLGLGVGYLIKYQLDKIWVFEDKAILHTRSK